MIAPGSLRRSVLAAGLVLVGFVPAPGSVSTALAGQQQPDFSGTWRLDPDASEVGGEQGLAGLAGAAPEFLHVTQARNGSMVLSSRINPSQSRGYQIGGESRVPAAGGEDARITVRTDWQGDSLVSEGEGQAEGVAVSVREVMSLHEGGEQLHLEVRTSVDGNVVVNRLVFRRQHR